MAACLLDARSMEGRTFHQELGGGKRGHPNRDRERSTLAPFLLFSNHLLLEPSKRIGSLSKVVVEEGSGLTLSTNRW